MLLSLYNLLLFYIYRWSFAKSEVSVTVTSGNTDLPAKSLVIDGFDVQGTINTADVLIDDIYIGIFAEKVSI